MHSVDHPRPSRQRAPHNDASMLDGDSAHGNPGEPAGDEWALDTDTDVVDEGAEDELEDAVADPLPEGEDEIEAFEAGAEPDAATAGPKTTEVIGAEVDDDEDEVDEDEGDDEDDAEEEDGEELDEEEVEDDEDSAAGSEATTSALEAEIGREMDQTSTDPANPTSLPSNATEATPPIDGYDDLTVPQVLAKAGELDDGQLNAVLEYERANCNRKTLVTKLTRLTTEA